tara:strand:- start:405 stop:1628 length:1224 start_codon:yes stop_codon:yes gene_type:complete
MTTTSKTVNCPLHGFITLTPRMCQIVDTLEFKRLYRLRQLGATYLVYPSANHTRYEHSLGVSHLAKLLMLSLRDKNPSLNIDNVLIELVQIAGLIHDIGHGPFSHLYDDIILNPEDPKHEERGIEIFKKMVKKYNLPFSSKEIEFIVEIINPSEKNKNNWLYQIIANKYCSIDVDKIDYIQRDSYHLGFGLSEKYERLITNCEVKVIDDFTVLAWPDKLQDEIMSLFETRYRLHKRVYCHHTVKAAEFIIIEILREIQEKTSIQFEDFYDDIIAFPFTDPKIKYLQNQLNNRLFPKLIGEKIATVCSSPDSDNTDAMENQITEFVNILNTKKKTIYCRTKIGFISGNGENPLKNVPYFNKHSSLAYKVCHYSSFMAPKNCQEYIYRIYIEDTPKINTYRNLWKAMIK